MNAYHLRVTNPAGRRLMTVPDAANPGSHLRGGEFYSPIQARLRTGEVLPRHQHELAYVTVVLRGDYLEGDRGRLDELRPFTAVFNPAGIEHSTVIGPAGASFFTIELCEANLRHLGVSLPRSTTFDRGAGAMLWPGLHLYSAFKTQTADPLVLEAYVLELLGAIAGFEVRDKAAPSLAA